VVWECPDRTDRRAWLLALVLIVCVAPQVVLYTAISLAQAAQQSRDRFALAAGASTLENLATLAVVVAAGAMFGSGSTSPYPARVVICWALEVPSLC